MDEGRPTSGMRGRVTRRQAAPSDPSAGGAGNDGAHDDDGDDDGQGSTWKQEMDSIMNCACCLLVHQRKPVKACAAPLT